MRGLRRRAAPPVGSPPARSVLIDGNGRGTMSPFRRVTTVCSMLLVGSLTSAAPRVVARSSPGKTADACKASTQAALHACRAEAQSDKDLALGKCANVPDVGAAKACDQQASL